MMSSEGRQRKWLGAQAWDDRAERGVTKETNHGQTNNIPDGTKH